MAGVGAGGGKTARAAVAGNHTPGLVSRQQDTAPQHQGGARTHTLILHHTTAGAGDCWAVVVVVSA